MDQKIHVYVNFIQAYKVSGFIWHVGFRVEDFKWFDQSETRTADSGHISWPTWTTYAKFFKSHAVDASCKF